MCEIQSLHPFIWYFCLVIAKKNVVAHQDTKCEGERRTLSVSRLGIIVVCTTNKFFTMRRRLLHNKKDEEELSGKAAHCDGRGWHLAPSMDP